MDIFKENLHKCPKNVIYDLYKLCAKLLYKCIRSFKKEQLKLHQSLLGVKGGGGNSPLFNIIAVMVKINYFRPNFS